MLWRAVYLKKMPTALRKIEVAMDWMRSILFPPTIVQLQLNRTLKVGQAHFSAGDFVFRKGDLTNHFYVIEHGRAGVYVDEKSSPASVLQPGDYFGEDAAGTTSRRSVSIKAETELDVILLRADDLRRVASSLGALKRDIQRSLVSQRGYVSFLELTEREPKLLERRVSEWMSTQPETLSPEMTLEQTVNRFHHGRAGYPVTDKQGALVGYCGRTQLYDALRALLPPATPLREFLLPDPPVVTENQRPADVLAQLAGTYVEALPVLAADGSRRVVGVLSPIEIFRDRVRTAA
jgi:CRP-like cAMP-binding protein